MAGEESHGVTEEFSALLLGDARLDARLSRIARALEARPDVGFPQAMGTDAATEGFYRFLGNKRVSWLDLTEAHVRKTHERAVACEVVLAVHDSSLCQFEGDCVREGLFRSGKNMSGFLAHTCIAVDGSGTRRPLGLLGMIPVVRPKFGAPTHGSGKVYDNEAHRWSDLVACVVDEVPRSVRLIHVMDREGDAYHLLDFLQLLEQEFVVRLAHDRRVPSGDGLERLSTVLAKAPLKLKRSVYLSRRTSGKRPTKQLKTHPSRDERMASLEVRAVSTQLRRPPGVEANADQMPVNVVQVVEVDTPEGEEAVSWTLVTSLPIDTPEQVAAIIDAYRARWLIEEFFKALKTGCAYEDRQLESLDALLVAFSLLAPVAWRLLALRWMSRNEEQCPATEVFTQDQLTFLRSVDLNQRNGVGAKPTIK